MVGVASLYWLYNKYIRTMGSYMFLKDMFKSKIVAFTRLRFGLGTDNLALHSIVRRASGQHLTLSPKAPNPTLWVLELERSVKGSKQA